jgi:vitamin B12 transporter
MKKHLFHLSTLAVLCTVGSVSAQKKKETEKKRELLEEVVITDSRFKIKKENSGKVVHKITAEQIEQNKGKSLANLLNSVAGIEINGSRGNAGQNLGYYIRGGRSNEVAILIDGIQVIDPLQNSYDLRTLNLDLIESIEIIKGAASTLYGSGAATAVINIKLKKASKETISVVASSIIGTNKTQNSSNDGYALINNANVSGTTETLSYAFSVGHQRTEGVSAAKPANGVNSDLKDDPFSRLNVGLNLDFELSDSFSLTAFGNFNTFTNNFDGGSYIDAENKSVNDNYRLGLSPKYKYENGSIQLNATYNQYKVNNTLTSSPAKNEGESFILDAFVKHKFSRELYAILGFNHQNNTIETYNIPWGATELTKTVYSEEPIIKINDPYANIVYISPFGLNINSGLRLNNHNKYGNHLVYNINPSYTFKYNDSGYSKVFASYSTAFVAPSLQELYASWGNLELKPQESLTYESGFESKFNSFVFNFTYFKREVENIISYNSTLFKMVNQGDATIEGTEIGLKYDFNSNISFDGNYTYTDHNNNAIRIPANKVNANLTYRLKEKTNLLLGYRYSDAKGDTYFKPDYSQESLTLSAFSVFDLSANHQLRENLKLFASVTNILDAEFEEIIGYSTLGRNFSVGAKINF